MTRSNTWFYTTGPEGPEGREGPEGPEVLSTTQWTSFSVDTAAQIASLEGQSDADRIGLIQLNFVP